MVLSEKKVNNYKYLKGIASERNNNGKRIIKRSSL